MTHERHTGPLVIQRPFYPAGSGSCHVYLLHPPGGVAGGDQLSFDTTLGPECEVLITTPGATKYYRSAGRAAQQTQMITVGRRAFLEWFPQETIVFDAADVSLRTEVELAEGAGFIGWEILCLGRRASGQVFSSGRVRQCFEVKNQKGPLILDRALYEGGSAFLSAAFGLDGASVVGVLLIAQATEALVAAICAVWNTAEALVSATLVNSVAICRYLGHSANEAKALFTEAWLLAKTELTGHRPELPRIWAT